MVKGSAVSTIFKVFGMTQLGNEPQPSACKANIILPVGDGCKDMTLKLMEIATKPMFCSYQLPTVQSNTVHECERVLNTAIH